MEKKINGRPLTRKNIRDLKKKGFVLGQIDQDDLDAVMDDVFGMALPPDEVSEMENRPYCDSLALFHDIIRLTYGKPDTEKNLSAPGNGEKATAPGAAVTAGRKAAETA